MLGIEELEKAVVIQKLEPIVNNERGTGWQIQETIGLMQVTYWDMKKGSFGGRHVHTGSDPSKKPEVAFLVNGSAQVVWWEPGSSQKVSRIIKAGTMIKIPAGIAHTIYYLDDSLLVEHRITWFDKNNPDTTKVEEPE